MVLPFGTDITALITTFTVAAGASVKVKATGISQVSGQTPNNFTTPVTYVVTASDGVTTENFTVSVTVALNSTKSITAYSLNGIAASSITNNIIAINLPYSGDPNYLKNLTVVHTITGQSIAVTSGSEQDFSKPVVYTVIAADGSSQTYTVNVTVALNSAKSITIFSLNGVAAASITNNIITVNLPYSGDPNYLKNLTVVHAITGQSIAVTSGSEQDFSKPVVYTVTAADGSTQTYTVNVTVALNSAKSITAYSLNGVAASSITNNIITVNLPYSGDPNYLKNLTVARIITGQSIVVTSGSEQDFSKPVVYTVTAADGSSQTYTVNVTVALNSAKSITAYSLNGVVASSITNNTIIVNLPNNSDPNYLKNLTVAHTITGQSIAVTSGSEQDFSKPVVYTVTAVDGSTQIYTVNVTVNPNLVTINNQCSKDINYFSNWGGVTTISTNTIAYLYMDPTYFFNMSISNVISCTFVPSNNYSGADRSMAGSIYCNNNITVSVPTQYNFIVTCN